MIETPCRDVPLDEWATALSAARSEGFDFFDWMTAVDETDAEESPGFDLVCHLMNSSTGHSSQSGLARLLVRTRVPNGQSAASVTGLWAGAAWHERETNEMFGIDFDGFDDGTGQGLRPLLLPNGFEGTPLRKSFVLAARASKAWPGAKEPGEGAPSHAGPQADKPGRRKITAPGVPDITWGPR
ncbi:MAG TPA: NADH-quinone oxidoreductase subunit C [Dermatophilaceae bacterium]|nr:NADH-quinone oxidoreductase subunit C [Dermatophilaceae bacterium]